MIQRADRDWAVWGRISGVDFDEKTIEFTWEGDLKPLVKDRYVIIPADTLHMMTLRLQAKEKAA